MLGEQRQYHSPSELQQHAVLVLEIVGLHMVVGSEWVGGRTETAAELGRDGEEVRWEE